jgi:predicted  nucleic acid-binding Zn-ribbon protein
MPYKCVHCNKVYEDGSKELLEGCSGCHRKFFFYIRPEKMKSILENSENIDELSLEEKNQIEEDIREISGIKEQDEPVFLDFESVRIVQHGKYLLDIGKLFAMKTPRIYQLEDGKYVIDLAMKKDNNN